MPARKVTLRLLCLGGLLAAQSALLAAQETRPLDAPGPAAGIVRTTQGIPVPGATVRLVHLASGRAWVSWTDENGKFQFPALPAGRYRAEAEQLAFAPASEEVELSAATPAIVLTIRVAPLGALASGMTPKPAPESAASSKTESAKTAEPARKPPGEQQSSATSQGRQAPQNGAEQALRQRLRQLGSQEAEPTAQQGGAGQESTGPADLGPLGEASSSDAFLISGTVSRGATPGSRGGFNLFAGSGEAGGSPGAPSEGTPFPGQAGGPGGMGPGGFPRGGGPGPGQGRSFGEGVEALRGLQRVLRQQVNRIRFSFYDRYGNSALDARPYSLTEPNPAKISTWRERFGGNVGGPLRIPRVYDGREKTFFFVNFEVARTRDPVDTFATVPTAQERLGDFTDRGVPLFDPSSNPGGSRTSFGSTLPAARLDPAALGLLQFISLPNLPGLVQNFHLQTRVPTATERFTIRLLHTISSKFNLSGFYNLSQTSTHAFQSFPDFESNQSTRGQNLTLGLTQQWTQRFIHDTRVFWTRSRTRTLNQFAFKDNIGADLGITGISANPIDFGVPVISLTNFTDLNDPVPALQRNQTLRFVDSLSWSLPKHTLRAGGEIRRMQINTVADPTPRGAFTFTGLMTSQLDATGQPVPGTGFDFADFLLGLPQSTTERFGSSATYFRSWGFVGYFQDDWRIHPRFTLNGGLRYEAVTPPIELFNHIANLDVNQDFTAVATVIPGQIAPFSGSLPRSLLRGDYNNWSPRIGIAWKPSLGGLTQKHAVVVRAGYGIFYNESIYNQLVASMANQPPFAQAQTRLTSAAQLLTLENGFPPAPQTTAGNTLAVDPNYRVGYVQLWNLTVETQLAQNLMSEVTYTGTKGTHLDMLRAPNRAPPGSPLGTEENRRIANALGFTYDTYGASSIYHALQVRVQRRFAHGLMLAGLYTYGKSIDNASSIGGGSPVVIQDDKNFRLDRGLSSFDVRHQFRANYVYELPFGERRRWAHRGWHAAAFGNWTISGYGIARTGTPFTARVLGTAANNSGTGANFSERADQVGDPLLPSGQRTPLHFFNTAAFVLPPPGRFGDAARNTIPGPGNWTVNFALARRIPFGKDQQHRLDLRWEVANLTNTPDFTGLSTVVNSATYGRVLSTQPMRTMNFVLRFNF